MTVASKPPPPHVSPTAMWVCKLLLRILQFVLAIAVVGCVGRIVSTGIWRILSLVVITPQAVISAIWAFSEGICIIARGGRRGIHPGANVALDLLLWLALLAGTAALWALGVATNVARDALSQEALDDYNREHADDGVVYEYDPEVLQTLADVAGMGQALIGLGATLTILHFITFVIACVETHQRRRSKAVVYIPAAQNPPPQEYHQQYPEPQKYPEPQQYPQQYPHQYPQQTQYSSQYGQDSHAAMYQPGPPEGTYQHPSVKG